MIRLDELNTLFKDVENGTASVDDANSLAIAVIAYASSLLNGCALAECETREAARQALDDLDQARKLIVGLKGTLGNYPHLVTLAASLSSVFAYSAASIVPDLSFRGSGDDQELRIVTYAIMNPDSGLIKIGKTNRLQTRVSALQTGAGRELAVIGTIAGDHERQLHRRFAHLRAFGEWFRDSEIQIRDLFARGYEVVQ